MGSTATLPSNLDAEAVIVGALITGTLRPGELSDLRASISAADFLAQRNALIFDAAASLLDSGRAVDVVAVKAELERRGRLEAAGGGVYLAELMDGLPRVSNTASLAAVVRGKATLRRITHAAHAIAQSACQPDSDPDDVLDRAQEALLSIAGKARKSGFHDNRALWLAAYDRAVQLSNTPDGIVGLRTGLIDLDAVLQGMRPGQLITVAARLGQGKSILGLQLADAVAEQGLAVPVFSMEMSGTQLMQRRMSAAARVSFNTLHRADQATKDGRLQRLAATADALVAPNVMIHTSAHTVPQMRAALREAQTMRGSLGAVVVDYLQLMDATQKHERGDQAISEISKGLKRLATDFQVPLISLSQLNRMPEQRADKRPSVGDIAEGDSVARDSDVVILIHREDAKGDKADPAKRGIAELIVGKNREGWEKPVKVRFNRHLTRFENLAQEGPRE